MLLRCTFILLALVFALATHFNIQAQKEADTPTPESEPDNTPKVSDADSSRFDAGRFNIVLPDGWKSAPSDFGSELAIIPREADANRAIDVSRDAFIVEEGLERDFASNYATALAPPVKCEVDPLRYGLVGDFNVVEIRLRPTEDTTRLQEHWLLYTDDGVYTFVITTRDTHAHNDFAAARSLIESLELKNNLTLDNELVARVSKSFKMPDNWLAQEVGGEIRFNAPITSKVNAFHSGLKITWFSYGIIEYKRRTFLDRFEKQLKTAYSEVTSYGGASALHARLPAFDVSLSGEYTKTKTTLSQRSVLLFDKNRTYVLTLSATAEDFESFSAIFDSLLKNFSPRLK